MALVWGWRLAFSYWLFRELPKRWEATTQEVGSNYPRGGKLLPKRWEATTQEVGSNYPRGGKLLPKRWEATTQEVGSNYPSGGKQLPKWWEATTQEVGSYYPSGGKLLYKKFRARVWRKSAKPHEWECKVDCVIARVRFSKKKVISETGDDFLREL
jgi:hypothetical protein